jgi:O-antigen ligase
MDAWSVIRDFPLAGTGLNTYWAAALFYQRHELAHFFAQAHNDYLQLAAEGGLLLILPAVACLAIFIRDVRRARREEVRGSVSWWLRSGAVTSLLAIACQETVEFSLQMPGNAALFVVVCAIAVHRPPSGEFAPDPEPCERRLRLVTDPAHRAVIGRFGGPKPVRTALSRRADASATIQRTGR